MSTVSNSKTFAAQIALGAYCRTGNNAPISSKNENTSHYRRLIYNVIEDALRRAYPITIKTIGEKKWQWMVDTFTSNHWCQTPQIWKLPYEFYQYFEKNAVPFTKYFPYLTDLLHYEWLEIEVFMMEDIKPLPYQKTGDFFSDIWVPNPEIKILILKYPVHSQAIGKISEQDKGQYFATIHRNSQTKQVAFNDFSYPFIELLLHIHEQESTFTDLVKILTKYNNDKKLIEKEALRFLNFSFDNDILLGFKQASN